MLVLLLLQLLPPAAPLVEGSTATASRESLRCESRWPARGRGDDDDDDIRAAAEPPPAADPLLRLPKEELARVVREAGEGVAEAPLALPLVPSAAAAAASNLERERV